MDKEELLYFAAQAMGPDRVQFTDYSDQTPDHWISRAENGSWEFWDPMESNADALVLIAAFDMWERTDFKERLANLTAETDFPKIVCIRWVATFIASEIGKAIEQTGEAPPSQSILDKPHKLLRTVLAESDEFLEGEARRGNFVSVSPVFEGIRTYLQDSAS
jgi:hypothetical protein